MSIQRPITTRAHWLAFSQSARAAFAQAYPDAPAVLTHEMATHPLFSHEALAQLGARMPAGSVEYNLGNLPLGVRPEETPANGLSLVDTIRSIDTNGSWVVLKNVERDTEYGALVDSALAELEHLVIDKTGPMLSREAFIFLSSPGSVTPFHIDPEHNILLQIDGEKTMTVFPAGDEALVPPEQSESFHGGGHRNLPWETDFLVKGQRFPLVPGEAILMPVKAPHFVENGDAVSISFSITWRSERSVAEGELHGLNRILRRRGLPTPRVGQKPEARALRRLLYRVMRRLGA
ncbi:hypothetical protein BH10PSE12_BH10PSE12_16180 [soil metagenome]